MSEPALFARCDRYSEGVVIASGRIYYSMTALSVIVALPAGGSGGEQRVWSHVPGANGHAIRADGSHVVMSSTGALLELDDDGRIIRVAATQAGGKALVYPNGVALDAHRGGYFVTDSGYTSMPDPLEGQPQGRVVRVDATGAVSVVADEIAYANGIGLSPGGETLYVGESLTRTLWSYPVAGDGTLGSRALFAVIPAVAGVKSVPDGITVSRGGALYVAHYGAGEVLVYAPDGRLERRIPAGNRAVSHVAVDEEAAQIYTSGGIESESGAGALFVADL